MFGTFFIRHFSTTNWKKVTCRNIKQIQRIARQKSKETSTVKGWVQAVRKHKNVAFVDVVDGSCSQAMQVVLPPNIEGLSKLSYGSSVSASGLAKHLPGKKPDVEMDCQDITVISYCDPEEYPFVYKDNMVPGDMRQFLHLRLRQRTFKYLLRVRNFTEMALHQIFQKMDFLHIHTPILSSNDCEGGGELFTVTTASDKNDNELHEYFQSVSYLTVSSQLHLEACVHGIRNVYTMSPVFRAEKQNSKKHLSEFYMFEAEMAFVESCSEVMDFIEQTLKCVMTEVLDKCANECQYFYQNIAPLDHENVVSNALNHNFIRITYDEAIQVLNSEEDLLHHRKAEHGEDLNTEQELLLTEHFGNKPVFVYDYPALLKPFYVKQHTNIHHQNTAQAVDLLFPFVGELCGGSVREDNYDAMSKRLSSLGLAERYSWYNDLRKYGSVPHAGYGLGFDRLIKFLLGINNIKDVVPFPRTYHSCQL